MKLLARVLVALAIATLAGLLAYYSPQEIGERAGDFGQLWASAVALLEGADPYQVIGPGRAYAHEFPFLYPLTATLAVLPLGFLEEQYAGVVFVFATAWILAFALTKDGWQGLPLFLSVPFIAAAGRVQWSPLLTAALLVPGLAFVWVLKPNIGLALFLSLKSKRTVKMAVVGGSLLLAASLLILPQWPAEWLEATRSGHHMRLPITLPGGFLVLLALLHWRRWEARLILALALMPQTIGWYDALPLLLVARTFRESLLLSFATAIGFLLQLWTGNLGALLIATSYLPALLVVLLRYPLSFPARFVRAFNAA